MGRQVSPSEKLRNLQERRLLSIFCENFNIFFSRWKTENSCESCLQKHKCWIVNSERKISKKLCFRYCLAKMIYEDEVAHCEDTTSPYDPQEVCDSLIQTLGLWENGSAASFPSSSTLFNLSNIFGCSINDFFVENKARQATGIPRKDVLFYSGTFYVYSKRPSNGAYNIGLLHITTRGQKSIAYYRWKIEEEFEDYFTELSRIEENPGKYFSCSNDYLGEVCFVEGSLILNLRSIETADDDMIHIFMPQLKMYHDNVRRTTGHPLPMKGGVGILSTLEMDTGRVPLSYKICFCDIEINGAEKLHMIDEILNPSTQPNMFQYIKIKNDEAREFIEYLCSLE